VSTPTYFVCLAIEKLGLKLVMNFLSTLCMSCSLSAGL
jgi:hypothetical protein